MKERMQENWPAARPTAAVMEAVGQLAEELAEIIIIIIIIMFSHQGTPPGSFYVIHFSAICHARDTCRVR
jgi:hypothetical protein